MIISVEGIDCAGKSTLINELKKMFKENENIVFCQEFDSPFANNLHELLRTNGSYLMKTFMFALDRAWVFENIAYSHLKRGGIVIWDRYVDSAYAYRYAENYKTDIANFEYVKKINSIFPKPDLTIYLEISVLTSIKRAKKANRKEPYNEELLTKAKLYYDDIYRNNDKCVIINGEQSITTIVEKIKHILEDKDERFRD